MTDVRPIGVFDSGVGGLTVLRALRKALPQENFIYLGDTARLPYGNKSAHSVQRYAMQATRYLLQQDIKLLVIACNTVTADALTALRAIFPDLPIIGVIDPGAFVAVNASTKHRIGVISTRATKNSKAYVSAIHHHAPNAEVFVYAAPLLVPLAEEGWTEGDLVAGIMQHYLQPILAHDIDCLVLGCTHYPPFTALIENLVSDTIKIVNSADTTAAATAEYLSNARALNTNNEGYVKFYCTDSSRFIETGSLFLNELISPTDLQLIDL